MGNYSGITLLSVIGKLFTAVINKRLNDWSDRYSVLLECQAGFRKGYGTVDQVFVLHGIVSHVLNRNRKLYCAFVDFRRAFDSINHKCLWFKLVKSGVRGKLFTLIKSLYQNVKVKARTFSGSITETISRMLGVMQGESLTPFLFAIYLN